MRSLVGSFVNRAPVPLAPRQTSKRTLFPWTNRNGAEPNEQQMATYEQVGTVFAIVSRLATAVAKADWTFYRKAESGLEEDRTPYPEHAIVDLWNKPNKFMNRRRFVEASQQHIDLTGETDPLVSYAKGFRLPLELWPMRPDRIQPVPDPYDFLAGYVYTSPDGERVPLDLNECLPILMPNPRDPYRGLGPVQAILTDIDSKRYSAEWNRMFFINSARPDGVIEVPEDLSDEEFSRLRDQWAANHQGVAKAHRVAILEQGAKWSQTSLSQKDMQFAELSHISRDVILEAFGFPKSVLGIVEDVNRANAEASEYLFAKWLVEERLDRWKDWLNFQLLPLFGQEEGGLYEWDYASPVPENGEADNAAITAKSAALVALTGAGFEPAEITKMFDWPNLSFTKPEPKVVTVPSGDPHKDE